MSAKVNSSISESNASSVCSQEQGSPSCPPCSFCIGGECKCGVYPYDVVHCNKTSSSILSCNCATFDAGRNVTMVGSCSFGCTSPVKNTLYRELPQNISNLNEMMCKPFNRTRVLCGRCLPDHYPLAYSLNLSCIDCPHVGWNWARYVIVAYLPLTVFYLLILLFRTNIASSHLHSVMMFCQALSIPIFSRLALADVVASSSPAVIITSKVALSLYGIWNLDFFRPFYTDICLGIGILPTLALDYIVALYPFFLMLITHLLIVLYDRNFKVVTIMWRPFQNILSFFTENWNIKTSIIDAFATFFLFANFKLLSVTFDLLTPTYIFELHHDHFNHSLGLYYAADIEYFGSEHLPYAILALVVLALFVIVPVIIFTLYPFSFFQKFLNLFPARWYILHTFMDSFLGSYKDGTELGTRDCRWFFSLFLWCRLCFFLSYVFKLNIMMTVTTTFILMAFIILMITVQPFKLAVNHFNTINTVMLQLLALFLLCLAGRNLSVLTMHKFTPVFNIVGFLTASVPLWYCLFTVVHWVFKRRKIIFKMGFKTINRVKARRKGYRTLSEVSEVEEGLSDRIINPDAYHQTNLSSFS